MFNYVPFNKPKVVTENYLELNIPQKFKESITFILEFLTNTYEYKDDIIEVRLFGSCSKQEINWDSDIDVLLIVNSQDTFTYSKRYLLQSLINENIENTFEVDFDVVVYTESQYINGNMPLTISIKQNNMLLYKKGVKEFG